MQDLNCIIDRKTGKSACPLQDVKIDALLGNGLAEVTLRQNYENTGGSNIEALYTFPLPHEAQVTGFVCRIGDYEVCGEFREKDAALAEYGKAVGRGDSAFLLESHRPDIFQISLGNIAAGEKASITISYTEELKIVDEELRWTLPSVVAPRYIPGKNTGPKTGTGISLPTSKVPDADYITPPIGDAAYTLSIRAVLTGISGIRKVSSPSHPVEIQFSEDSIIVSLAKETELLDSDFVLSVLVDSIKPSSYLTASDRQNKTYGSVSLMLDLEEIEPKQNSCEYIFMIDISGSMTGEKLEQAKRALLISLRNLLDGDYFNIVAFESYYTCFAGEAAPYSQQNLEKADKWVNQLVTLGGTEIFEPLKHILGQKPPKVEMERVVLLFTDGQVGNEDEIISLVKKHNRFLQMLPFGIDTAVNKYFIDGLAKAGNGMPEYIYPGERIEEKVIRQFSRIGQPALSGPVVYGKDGSELDAVPPLPARLYGSEVYSFMLYSDRKEVLEKIRVCGKVGDQSEEYEFTPEAGGDARLLGLKWAKGRIRLLEEQSGSGNIRRNNLISREIVELSTGYSLLSTMTSLVAVHKRLVRETGLPETIVVPVSKPRGWEMFNTPARPAAQGMARQVVSEPVSMRAYSKADSYSGVDAYSGCNMNEDLEIPTFLKKRNSRSGGIRMNEIDAPSAMAARTERSAVSAGKADTVDELIMKAAQSQNADGTFGTGGEAAIRTACFIIGMLTSGKDWKPYRIQIIKAGRALVGLGKALTGPGMASAASGLASAGPGLASAASGMASAASGMASAGPVKTYTDTDLIDLLLIGAAFSLLHKAKLLPSDELEKAMDGIESGLSQSGRSAFESLKSGKLPDLESTSGINVMNGNAGIGLSIRYLEKAIK